jgi:dihydrofolate synthase/folylpolyglutamate synthase
MDRDCLDSWIEFLEQPSNCVIDLTIERVLQVASLLNVTRFKCPVVTVAGTNGKGSCVASLESISLALDKRVAVFTSPHMHDLLERFRINGKQIDSGALCSALSSVYDATTNSDIRLTYFEYLTLAALVLFKSEDLDLVILEVGLGGRLDAVNVVENNIAIVTSISKDHCSFLGDTMDKIAAEKSGIFRKDSWAIFNEFENSVSVLKEKANQVGSKLCLFGKDFSINEGREDWSWTNKVSSFFNIPLVDFPVQNAALALSAASILYGSQVSSNILQRAFARLSIVGRYNKVCINGKKFILDVAHNPAGASWLLEKVRSNSTGKIQVIFQPLSRKDWKTMLKSWDKYVDKWYFINSENDEMVTSNELVSAVEYGDFEVVDSYPKALGASSESVGENDMVVVFGSFHLVSVCLKEYESLAA